MTSTVSKSMVQDQSILILGASGRLGLMLQECWPNGGELTCQSRHVRPGFVPFDPLLEPEKMIDAMIGKRAVICLAGITPARAALAGDGYGGNTSLAIAAIEAAKIAGVGRVFLASSAAVYGAMQGALVEDCNCEPVSEYGRSKLEMEQAGIAKGRKIGQQVTALRIGNVAGADAILGGWRPGMTIDRLPNGGTPLRSYIGPQTMARAMRALVEADALPEVLNFATPGAVEMGALLDAADLPWAARVAGEGVIAKVSLSTKLLEKHVSFDPEDSTAAKMVAEWRGFQAQG